MPVLNTTSPDIEIAAPNEYPWRRDWTQCPWRRSYLNLVTIGQDKLALQIRVCQIICQTWVNRSRWKGSHTVDCGACHSSSFHHQSNAASGSTSVSQGIRGCELKSFSADHAVQVPSSRQLSPLPDLQSIAWSLFLLDGIEIEWSGTVFWMEFLELFWSSIQALGLKIISSVL